MAKEGEEVVPSGKALALVKKWMAAFDDDEPEELPEEPQLRPTRLGLGAKFVPHSQVLSTMNPLERKLRAKIENSRKATAGNETTSGKSNSKGFHGKAAPLGRGPAEEEEDTDDEEESRASAFAKRATNAVASSGGGAQNVSLADRGGQAARKKRKKRRKNGDGGGGGGGE